MLISDPLEINIPEILDNEIIDDDTKINSLWITLKMENIHASEKVIKL